MNATSCYWSYIEFYTLITNASYITYLHLQFWYSRRSRIQKQPPKVPLKLLKIFHENNCVGAYFLQSCKPSATLLKGDSCTGAFLWNLRNSKEHLFSRTSKRLLLCIDYFIMYWFLQSSTVRFSFLQITSSFLLYYAVKTIDLMTLKAVSFEEVLYCKKFLAFES